MERLIYLRPGGQYVYGLLLLHEPEHAGRLSAKRRHRPDGPAGRGDRRAVLDDLPVLPALLRRSVGQDEQREAADGQQPSDDSGTGGLRLCENGAAVFCLPDHERRGLCHRLHGADVPGHALHSQAAHGRGHRLHGPGQHSGVGGGPGHRHCHCGSPRHARHAADFRGAAGAGMLHPALDAG